MKYRIITYATESRYLLAGYDSLWGDRARYKLSFSPTVLHDLAASRQVKITFRLSLEITKLTSESWMTRLCCSARRSPGGPSLMVHATS